MIVMTTMMTVNKYVDDFDDGKMMMMMLMVMITTTIMITVTWP